MKATKRVTKIKRVKLKIYFALTMPGEIKLEMELRKCQKAPNLGKIPIVVPFKHVIKFKWMSSSSTFKIQF